MYKYIHWMVHVLVGLFHIVVACVTYIVVGLNRNDTRYQTCCPYACMRVYVCVCVSCMHTGLQGIVIVL